jgi:hypothetical protein
MYNVVAKAYRRVCCVVVGVVDVVDAMYCNVRWGAEAYCGVEMVELGVGWGVLSVR